jgi:hypothetical protein
MVVNSDEEESMDSTQGSTYGGSGSPFYHQRFNQGADNRNKDDHYKPIAIMGDIENYLSKKHIKANGTGVDEQSKQQQLFNYLRDPALSDYENSLLHRPYCGNPFIAPGELGSKAARRV